MELIFFFLSFEKIMSFRKISPWESIWWKSQGMLVCLVHVMWLGTYLVKWYIVIVYAALSLNVCVCVLALHMLHIQVHVTKICNSSIYNISFHLRISTYSKCSKLQLWTDYSYILLSYTINAKCYNYVQTSHIRLSYTLWIK